MSAANGFAPMPDRLVGELSERQAMAARALPYYQTFLADYLRVILPHDLVLLLAWSGLGKTELALWIAAMNASGGKRVHYFALEAEPRELERRRKYALIARLAFQHSHPHRDALNFTDWYLGACEHIAGEYNAQADEIIADRFSTLHTFYRGDKHFGAEQLCEQIALVKKSTSLIVIDHLHYIDENESLSESRALTETVKAIRDASYLAGKPVILVAHLRKKERGEKTLVPTLDDVHGTSNVAKICTSAIAIAPAPEVEARWWFHAPTYITVLKDRRSRPCPYVAVQSFDQRTKAYVDEYTLGRIKGTKWEETKLADVPSWAKHHRPLEPQTSIHPSEVG